MSYPTKAGIEAFLKTQILQLLEQPDFANELSGSISLLELGIDSIMLVNLVVQIEQEYNVFFEDDELMAEHFSTIEVVSDLVLRKLEIGA